MTQNPENRLLRAALSYAARGWPVHPLDGKAATVRAWPTEASTDPPVIGAWWADRPAANIGIVTGHRSGLAVLDVDPRNGGGESLAALRERVRLPETLTTRTGSGGLHLFYADPDGAVSCGTNVLGAGLDVKGTGGYVVAPPSVHPDTGQRYAVAHAVELAPWPAGLDVVRAEFAATRRVSRPPMSVPSAGGGTGLLALCRWVAGQAEGGRNAALFWAACRATEQGAHNLGPLLRAALAAGLSEHEAARTIDSAQRTVGAA